MSIIYLHLFKLFYGSTANLHFEDVMNTIIILMLILRPVFDCVVVADSHSFSINVLLFSFEKFLLHV
jgi:hypothetical protein